MCRREHMSLQRGMNFRNPPATSVVLMSRRPSAPYEDVLSEDGRELIYEGHDAARSRGSTVHPKSLDQPWLSQHGKPTENAKFAQAAGAKPAALVRVYEKLRDGIWSDRGLFEISRYEFVPSGQRKVFKFHMRLSDIPDEREIDLVHVPSDTFRRVIPSWVKQKVFQRDKGQCVLCGSSTELHFDHDLPYARGGTGLTPENVRILCARHNLKKSDRIE